MDFLAFGISDFITMMQDLLDGKSIFEADGHFDDNMVALHCGVERDKSSCNHCQDIKQTKPACSIRYLVVLSCQGDLPRHIRCMAHGSHKSVEIHAKNRPFDSPNVTTLKAFTLGGRYSAQSIILLTEASS